MSNPNLSTIHCSSACRASAGPVQHATAKMRAVGPQCNGNQRCSGGMAAHIDAEVRVVRSDAVEVSELGHQIRKNEECILLRIACDPLRCIAAGIQFSNATQDATCNAATYHTARYRVTMAKAAYGIPPQLKVRRAQRINAAHLESHAAVRCIVPCRRRLPRVGASVRSGNAMCGSVSSALLLIHSVARCCARWNAPSTSCANTQ